MHRLRLSTSLSSALCIIMMLVLSGCHAGRKATPDRPGHPRVDEIHVGHAGKLQQKIIEEASTWIGTPYVYAGAEKGKGTDCSGMVMKVYETVANRKIPRNSAKQAEFCLPIAAEEVATGDLVFFATGKDPQKVSHVGIVVDNENFIHASASKGVVVSKITSPYYQRTFRMFGRVPDNSEDRAER